MAQNGRIVRIYLSPAAGEPMQESSGVMALAGIGLEGDRYSGGRGSFNKRRVGHRQVTLINSKFFTGTGFGFADSRRNLITDEIELMALIGKEFQVGEATFRGVKYCDPCDRVSRLSRKPGFRDKFHDCGGLVAEVLESGMIAVQSEIGVISTR